MTVVSYAQANEDLLLFDALREVSPESAFTSTWEPMIRKRTRLQSCSMVKVGMASI